MAAVRAMRLDQICTIKRMFYFQSALKTTNLSIRSGNTGRKCFLSTDIVDSRIATSVLPATSDCVRLSMMTTTPSLLVAIRIALLKSITRLLLRVH